MNFIGGSNARTIMDKDEKTLRRPWREKRGEEAPPGLSDVLIVQLGLVTEDLNRRWYELNSDHRVSSRMVDDHPSVATDTLKFLQISDARSKAENLVCCEKPVEEGRGARDHVLRSGNRKMGIIEIKPDPIFHRRAFLVTKILLRSKQFDLV